MPTNKEAMSGNKGEWSELYTFLRLLDQGRVYAADEHMLRIEELYYPILKIIREEYKGEVIEYIIEENDVILCHDDTVIGSVPRSLLEKNADILLQEIQKQKGSFTVTEVEEFVHGISVTKLKAPAKDTSDIVLRIRDVHTSYVQDVGFSIKSEMGHPPTLVNASLATNFTYRIQSITPEQAWEMNAVQTRTKIKDRLALLQNYGGTLAFHDVDHPTFRRNLSMLDGDLIPILAEMLRIFYLYDTSSIDSIVKKLAEIDPLGYGDDSIYVYKVKQFLCATALGLKPATVWNGVDSANGGYLVVLEHGEILAYHLYNRAAFKQYLFDHTCLEKPSTTRHNYMNLYQENGELFMKLNLQVRFKR